MSNLNCAHCTHLQSDHLNGVEMCLSGHELKMTPNGPMTTTGTPPCLCEAYINSVHVGPPITFSSSNSSAGASELNDLMGATGWPLAELEQLPIDVVHRLKGAMG